MKRLSKPAAEVVRILGESIRAARLRRGWSVAALAERAGVTAQTITRIERGAPGVAIGTVFEAAHLAGVDLYGGHRDWVGLTVANELALLPQRGRARREADNDF
jgi:transcriptional regulator with XRE-family HTH domain